MSADLPEENVLEGLQRQLAAPRTPLLPSMDLFYSANATQQPKSFVDTLPPMDSVPPPAPFPAEAPPARPSVVPPVRLRPSSVPPPALYAVPARQSSVPPPVSSSEPPVQRLSSAPQPVRLSSAPPPSAEALRREAATIPADSRNVLQPPPPYDPSRPIPSLRVPTFPPQAVAPSSARKQENGRIGNIIFVLLMSLPIVTGAIMGINYSVGEKRGSAAPSQTVPAEPISTTKVRFERLTPNVIVAPSEPQRSTKTLYDVDTNLASPTEGTPREASDAASTSSKSVSPAAKSTKPNSSKNVEVTTSKRKRLDPKSVDTETPLIMD
jgi:hypothetical protein